jgi:hypothetical protein
MSVWRHPGSAAEQGRMAYARVRERFTLQHMAEAVERVYGEASRIAGASGADRPGAGSSAKAAPARSAR